MFTLSIYPDDLQDKSWKIEGVWVPSEITKNIPALAENFIYTPAWNKNDSSVHFLSKGASFDIVAISESVAKSIAGHHYKTKSGYSPYLVKCIYRKGSVNSLPSVYISKNTIYIQSLSISGDKKSILKSALVLQLKVKPQYLRIFNMSEGW